MTSLSDDIILYHISKYVNDNYTSASLMKLNRYIHDNSDKILFNEEVCIDPKYAHITKHRKQFVNIRITMKDGSYCNNIDFSDYYNTKKINIIDDRYTDLEDTNNLVIKYPIGLVSLKLKGVYEIKGFIPTTLVSLKIDTYCTSVSEKDIMACNKTLKYLNLTKTRPSSLNLESFHNLISLTVYKLDLFKPFKLPKNIKELYLRKAFYGFTGNKRTVDLSLKEQDRLEVFAARSCDFKGTRVRIMDLPKTLKILITNKIFQSYYRPDVYTKIHILKNIDSVGLYKELKKYKRLKDNYMVNDIFTRLIK